MSIHGREAHAAMTCCALLIALMAAPQPAPPTASYGDLTADLAAKIAAAVAPADRLRLELAGDPSADPAGRHQLQHDIAQRLEARGVRLVDAGAGTAVVRVGCSTNLRERVCAAEVKNGETTRAVLSTGPLDRESTQREPAPVLDMRHVFGQSAPILDVAVTGDRLIVLDPATVALYQRAGTLWQRRRSQPVAASRTWPRDMRGRLRVSGSSVEAFLPGAICRANVESFGVSCADERQPWPLALDNTGIAAGRNYFTTPEGLAFYGFAPLDADAGARWLIASQSSRLLLLDDGRRALESAVGSGDDVAGVTACGPGSFAIVSSRAPNGDGRDWLRLFRVVSRVLVPVASPLVLPGPVTALWTTPGASNATAVVRDAGADRYDAFQIGVSCGR